MRSSEARCLIIGIGGFLGSHLAEYLLDQGLPVAGTVRSNVHNLEPIKDRLNLWPCDILDKGQLEALLQEAQPGAIFHLAAQSLPVLSWQDPESTFRVNVFGTLNLLEAVRKVGLDPTIIVAGSTAEYGFSTEEEIPIKETKALNPASPYGVSKVAADLLSHVYWRAYGMKVIRARPFYVIGPRKSADVCSDFARDLVAVERGRQKSLRIGNLGAVRDFLDVHDATQAFWLLAEKGIPGEVYNVCSGVGHSVQEVLDILIALANVPVPVEPDPARLRPADEPVIIGDNSKLRALGWEPRIPLEETLRSILSHWRGVA